eukprot:scaffold33238_cov63-Phaeocystis_antarctica.AAC.2
MLRTRSSAISHRALTVSVSSRERHSASRVLSRVTWPLRVVNDGAVAAEVLRICACCALAAAAASRQPCPLPGDAALGDWTTLVLEPCGLFCPVDIDSPADALAHFDTIAAGSGVRCGLEGLGSGHLGEDISCVQLARGVGCACCRITL